MFCKYGNRFSFYVKKVFIFFARSANLYIFIINLPSSLPNYGRSNALPCLQTPPPKRRHMVCNLQSLHPCPMKGATEQQIFLQWVLLHNMHLRERCKRAQLHQQTNKYSPHHNSKRNIAGNTWNKRTAQRNNHLYRPQQSLQPPSTPGNLSTKNLKLKYTKYIKMSLTGNRAS